MTKVRISELAYEHIQDKPKRVAEIDTRAAAAGFDNSPAYIDHVMGHKDTRRFDGVDGRMFWVNPPARLYGWINYPKPAASTIVAVTTVRATLNEFRNYRKIEAQEIGIRPEKLLIQGPVHQKYRTIDRPQQQLQPKQQHAQAVRSIKERSAALNAPATPQKQEPRPVRSIAERSKSLQNRPAAPKQTLTQTTAPKMPAPKPEPPKIKR